MPSNQSNGPAPGNAVSSRRKKFARHDWRNAGYVALFVFLALVTAQTARLGAAGLFVQTAQFEIDKWASAGTPQYARDYNHVGKFFSASLQIAANNPWALEGFGALNLARIRTTGNPQRAVAAAREARVRFREALIIRPTSPYLWANVALAKLNLNEKDAELMTALRHADELGPWEPAVQQTFLLVGLAAWQELDPELRQAMARTIERGASRNAKNIYQTVKSYRRFDLICAINIYRSIAGPDCGDPAMAAK